MSRQALSTSCNSEPLQNKNFHFTSLINSARLPLLFGVALILTLFLAGGNVTAEKLFQSPQSPQSPPPEQPAPEQPTPEQPAPEQPQPPAEQPSAGPTAVEQSSPIQPTSEAAPAPTLEPLPPVTTGEEYQEVPPSNEDTPMVLDEAELIDSIFVSFAYVWLCCGVILLLLIPLVLLILYIRGRSKIVNEESF